MTQIRDQRLPDRFWDKVVVSDDSCWLWIAAKNGNGYGAFGIGSAVVGAHRVSYEALVGPIPDGFVMDHLCRVPCCVNPEHLQPVTQGENVRRAYGLFEDMLCPKGHMKIVLNNGRRRCRQCHTEAERQRRNR